MEQLGINLGFLIAQIINFLIVFGLLAVFAWKPLLAFLDARAEKVAKGLEDARVAEQARANAETEARKILDKARAEAQSIMAEARANAEERARPIVTAAEEEANRIRQEAAVRAEEARNSALSEVRGQVVALAMAAAQRLVGPGDAKQQERIVNEFFTSAATDIQGLSGNLVVTTALPLSDSERSSLAKKLGGTVSEWRVDPSILGGVVVRAGDRVVDGSVRSNLNALQSSLG